MRLEKSLKGKSGAGNPLRKCTEFKRLVSFCTAAIAIPVLAETYVWTGAVGNGKYADPGNWTVGGAVATTVPGRYKDSGGTEVGSFEDSVLFGPLTGVAEATIDFENAVSVSNFVIQSGAPAYTFGTSNQQTFKIINGVASSSQRAYMTVESGVETEQTFALGIVFGAQNYYTDIQNDGSKELVFLAGLGKPYNPYVTFLGTGDIRFKNYTARDYRGYNNSEGVLIFDTCTSSGTFKFLQSYVHSTNLNPDFTGDLRIRVKRRPGAVERLSDHGVWQKTDFSWNGGELVIGADLPLWGETAVRIRD